MNIEGLLYGSHPSEESGAWVHVSAPKNPENMIADLRKDFIASKDISTDFGAWNTVDNAVLPQIKREKDSHIRSAEQDLIWPKVSSDFKRVSSTVTVIPWCKDKYPSVPHLSTPCGVDIGAVRATLEAEPPQWMPDSAANCCLQCQTVFKPIVCGRHHCRLCGGIFCRNCSTGRCLLPVKFQERNPQRVCDICYQRLEPIQRILADRVSNASQIATHDVTDMTCMRGWLNSPLGFTMEQEIYKATNTLRSYYQIGGLNPDKLIPNAVLKGASGLAILTAIKVGLVVTYKVGTGLVLARRMDGTWSAPSAIACCGMGWGAQAGGELTDFIIVLRNSNAMKAFSGRLHVSIGAGLSAAVGPVGRVAEADLHAGDGGTAACYSYSYSKGAFLGASLEGNVMTTRTDTNHRFYGDPYISSWDILLGSVPRPRAASCLYNALHNLYGKFEETETDFVKNFRGHAQILEKSGFTQFTPHYITWYCPEAFILSKQCVSQCINHGRYCAPDPDQDFSEGYEGKDVVIENLRQLCVFRVANESNKPWVWWDYVTDFNIRCPMKDKKYNKDCAEDVIKSLDLPIDKVHKCMGDPQADAENPVLKAEQDAQVGQGPRGDVTILPTLVINNVQYRGKLERSAILKAICAGFKETTEPLICLSADVETNECLTNNGGCWQNMKANITACKDTFRGRVCECPLVSGVQFQGDGYSHCEAIGPARCRIENGGCWSETKDGETFSACMESQLSGCHCPNGFQGDGYTCVDIDECKERTACQCSDCSCKNNWGGFDCKCKGDLLYIAEQDTCIGRNASRFGWFLTLLVLSGLVGIGVAGYVFYKYRLRSYMDSEIMAIMSQYMPLDNQNEAHQPLQQSSV